jgi:hypothetical protein
VIGDLAYEPLKANLEDLQTKALSQRPDFRAAELGITAAQSQILLILGVGVGSVGQQRLRHIFVSMKQGEVQRRPPSHVCPDIPTSYPGGAGTDHRARRGGRRHRRGRGRRSSGVQTRSTPWASRSTPAKRSTIMNCLMGTRRIRSRTDRHLPAPVRNTKGSQKELRTIRKDRLLIFCSRTSVLRQPVPSARQKRPGFHSPPSLGSAPILCASLQSTPPELRN